MINKNLTDALGHKSDKTIHNYLKNIEKNDMTKIQSILNTKKMSQGDLIRLIHRNTGFKIGKDRISMICTGRLKNYTVATAVMLAEALEVPISSIVEIKNVKKENRV